MMISRCVVFFLFSRLVRSTNFLLYANLLAFIIIYWWGISHLISMVNIKLLHVWMTDINAARAAFNDMNAIFFPCAFVSTATATNIFLLSKENWILVLSIWPFYTLFLRQNRVRRKEKEGKKEKREKHSIATVLSRNKYENWLTPNWVIGDGFCKWSFTNSDRNLCWNHFTSVITCLFPHWTKFITWIDSRNLDGEIRSIQ